MIHQLRNSRSITVHCIEIFLLRPEEYCQLIHAPMLIFIHYFQGEFLTFFFFDSRWKSIVMWLFWYLLWYHLAFSGMLYIDFECAITGAGRKGNTSCAVLKIVFPSRRTITFYSL